ncbi:TIGR00645 family protein [bacterium]|nr:TIGR00645 family protein [bacterium]
MPTPKRKGSLYAAEKGFEQFLFASRWLMAPMYLCLVISLGMLTVIFVRETAQVLPHVLEMSVDEGILSILSLIDMSFAANLMLVVIFSGYENFVSKLDLEDVTDRPSWMGKVDFSGLKMKLIASIVAISGIHLLKVFMELGPNNAHPIDLDTLRYMVIIHLAFVLSGVLLALMDWLSSRAPAH